MLIVIPQVFPKAQVRELRAALDGAEWVDGKVTAGHQSAQTKQNSQIPEGHPVAQKVGDLILQALGSHPLFRSAALPLRVFPPLFNRYAGGQTFGTHVDNAIRSHAASGGRIRTDLSCTLFFSEPEEYDGGALVVEDTYGSKSVKLPAGGHGALSFDKPAPCHSGHAGGAGIELLLAAEHDPAGRAAHAAL